ncbi:MAG: hypothetical protein ACI8Y7_000694 [Candidatus Woesearchaeota archaeon]|jgi:hypothetical protein
MLTGSTLLDRLSEESPILIQSPVGNIKISSSSNPSDPDDYIRVKWDLGMDIESVHSLVSNSRYAWHDFELSVRGDYSDCLTLFKRINESPIYTIVAGTCSMRALETSIKLDFDPGESPPFVITLNDSKFYLSNNHKLTPVTDYDDHQYEDEAQSWRLADGLEPSEVFDFKDNGEVIRVFESFPEKIFRRDSFGGAIDSNDLSDFSNVSTGIQYDLSYGVPDGCFLTVVNGFKMGKDSFTTWTDGGKNGNHLEL